MLISAYDWDQQYLEEEQANRSVTGQDTIMTRATTDKQRNIEEQSLQVVISSRDSIGTALQMWNNLRMEEVTVERKYCCY